MLKQQQAGDPNAIARFQEHHPRLARHPASAGCDSKLSLNDAQHIGAREYGLPSWPKLKAHVDGLQKVDERVARLRHEFAGADLLNRFGARLDRRFAAGLGKLNVVKSFVNPDGSLTPDAGRLDDSYENWFRCERTRANILCQALHFACLNARRETAEFLLELGADVNQEVPGVNRLGGTVLHGLTSGVSMGAGNNPHVDDERRLPLIELLLRHGARVTLRDSRFHSTPLGWVHHHDATRIFNLLKPYAGVHDAVQFGLFDRLRELLGLPRLSWERGGWTLTFTPIPKQIEARGKPGHRIVGTFTDSTRPAFEPLDTRGPLIDALKKKASKYGRPSVPYVIALGAFDFWVEDESIASALFESEAVVLYSTNPDLTTTRFPNGFWAGKSGPQHQRVSAALFVPHLYAHKVASAKPKLWHNP